MVLLGTERGRAFAGRTFWLYSPYAISRFIIEFYRGDPRGMVMGLSTSQFISVVLAPLSIVMLIWLSKKDPEVPGEMPRPGRRKAAA